MCLRAGRSAALWSCGRSGHKRATSGFVATQRAPALLRAATLPPRAHDLIPVVDFELPEALQTGAAEDGNAETFCAHLHVTLEDEHAIAAAKVDALFMPPDFVQPIE
jgi:hypothetical protein